MRILLTGAGGFVGHHTLEHFLHDTDALLVCVDSFRHKGLTDRVAAVTDPRRVAVVTHDLTVPFSAQLRHRLADVTHVVSMASESHVERSIADPVPFVTNNVALTLNTLELARGLDRLESFIQVSTDEVYGPAPDGHAHGEWEATRPSNPYAASKAAQDAISHAYWRTYGLPVVVTHTMNIIGERQDPEKFVPKVISHVLVGDTIPIHGSSDGRPGTRFYLHARNQADALLHILENVRPALHGDGATEPDSFNVVGEREVDNLTMAQMVAEVIGQPLRYELAGFHSARPGHDLRYALDGSKLAAAGWKPPVPLEESLARTVRWTLDHREWLL